MSDEWFVDRSPDGGIELTRRSGGSGGTEFPPIIIIRGLKDVGDAPIQDLTDRYFVRTSDGTAPASHYVLGGTESELPVGAAVDAVTARLTSFHPDSGTFGAVIDGLSDS